MHDFFVWVLGMNNFMSIYITRRWSMKRVRWLNKGAFLADMGWRIVYFSFKSWHTFLFRKKEFCIPFFTDHLHTFTYLALTLSVFYGMRKQNVHLDNFSLFKKFDNFIDWDYSYRNKNVYIADTSSCPLLEHCDFVNLCYVSIFTSARNIIIAVDKKSVLFAKANKTLQQTSL